LKPVFDEYLNEYLNHMAAKGNTRATIYWHKCYLKQFLSYLTRENIPDLRGVTVQNLESYRFYLKEEHRTPQGKPITDGTYSCHLNAIHSFFLWLEKTGQILMAPVVRRQESKLKPARLPNVITEAEALRIIEACPVNSPTGLRNRAILELLYSTGIRRKELINLNVADFSTERREIVIIKGKGGRDRIVPIGEYAARFTETYLKLVRPWMVKDPDETALFISSTTGTRLTLQNMDKLLQKIVKQSGVTKRVTPHTFRHSMATHLLRNGADLRHIQAILGHASLSSTEIYTHLTKEDLKQALKKCHPHGKRAAQEARNDSGF
jgi:integrase/recombinase XerD